MTIDLTVTSAAALPSRERSEIVDLCMAAYGETFGGYLDQLDNPTHVLGRRNGRLVSHGCWVTRWLQPGALPPLRTAYVEAVATLPAESGRCHATAIMRQIPEGRCRLRYRRAVTRDRRLL